MKDNIFIRSWLGKASLSEAFWLVYLLFGIVLDLIVMMLIDIFFRHGNISPYLFTLTAPYTLYGAICVWRCSTNAEWVWKFFSRVIVSIGVLGDLINIGKLFINE